MDFTEKKCSLVDQNSYCDGNNATSNIDIVNKLFEESASFKLSENLKKYSDVREKRDKSKLLLKEANEIRRYDMVFPEKLEKLHKLFSLIRLNTELILNYTPNILNYLELILNRLNSESCLWLNPFYHDSLDQIFQLSNQIFDISTQMNQAPSALESVSEMKCIMEKNIIQIGNITNRLQLYMKSEQNHSSNIV